MSEEEIYTYEFTTTVDQGQDWKESLRAACPDTTEKEYLVDEVFISGHYFPPLSKETEKVNLVLRRFEEGEKSFDRTVSWANEKGLQKTNPRELFAVVRNDPYINLKLHVTHMRIIATQEASLTTGENKRGICSVYIGRNDHCKFSHIANLNIVTDTVENCWALFRK